MLVAIAVPVILVVNGFRLAATDGFVRLAYERDGFPRDRLGLEAPARLKLALLGLEAIMPGGDGTALLEQARLPDGERAFNARELTHMEDVRGVLGGALRIQLLAAAGIVLLALLFARSALRGAVATGLLVGAAATLGIAVAAVPTVVAGFDGVFLRFHQLFFEGQTWRFPSTDTLIRVYPEAFWVTTAQVVAAATLVQAIVLAFVAATWRRRARRIR